MVKTLLTVKFCMNAFLIVIDKYKFLYPYFLMISYCKINLLIACPFKLVKQTRHILYKADLFSLISIDITKQYVYFYFRNLKYAHLTPIQLQMNIVYRKLVLNVSFKISDVQILIIICFVSKKNNNYVFKG